VTNFIIYDKQIRMHVK